MSNLFCLVCNKSFPETELSGHVASVHLGFLPFACTCCEFIAAQESEVLRHADKEGHIPFVADRTNVKPYLSLLTSLIVGHCQTFAESKNFTEILSGLTSQIAANKNGLVRLKFQMQIEPNRDADVSSERSSSTLLSALISNSLAVNSPASITENSSLDSADSKSANQDSSADAAARVPQQNNANTTPIADACENKALAYGGPHIEPNATEMCALCVSDEVFHAEQKEGHVIRHVERSGASTNQNPAIFFASIAETWQRCFPSQTPPSNDVAMETMNGVSPSLSTKKPKHLKGYTVCTLCDKCVRISAKKKHIWQEHMGGADCFSCGSCASKGLVKGALEQACAELHPDVPADIKPLPVSVQQHARQYFLCFGNYPGLGGKPTRSSVFATPASADPPEALLPAATSPLISTNRRCSSRHLNHTRKSEVEQLLTSSTKSDPGSGLGKLHWRHMTSKKGKLCSRRSTPVDIKQAEAATAKATIVECQLCSAKLSSSLTRRRRQNGLRVHALACHFDGPQKLFECSACGYGNNTWQNKVVKHVKKQHPADKSVRMFNHRAKYAARIKRCFDACFPTANLAASKPGPKQASSMPPDLSPQDDGAKCEVQSGAVHDSVTLSERSANTPQSSLISNAKPDIDACHSRLSCVTSSLPESSSRPVDTSKTYKSPESLIPVCGSSSIVHDKLNIDVLPVHDQVPVGTLCALCASNEAFSADQREGHVFQHLDRNKTALSSSISNPAEYFSELAKMWQRCFPPIDSGSDSNSSGGIKASPERHAIKVARSFPMETHVKCLQCSEPILKTVKTYHVWRDHMSGFDRFVCTICDSKGMQKYVVERGCSSSHAGIPSKIQRSSLSSQVFDQQFELCFGHLPLPVGRPAGRSLTGSTPDTAVAVTKPINEAASSEEIGSVVRRYPSTRRSLNTRIFDRTDANSQSINPGKSNCSLRLSSKVHSVVLKRPRSRIPSGRVNRSVSPVGAAWKALKLRGTKRVESSSYAVPNVPVPDSRPTENVQDKVSSCGPQKRELPGAHMTLCGLCQYRVPSVGYASHVWMRHMSGYQRLTCEVCDSKHNFLPRLHAECIVRHPESKPIIKMDQSRELRAKYVQRYLQCFAVQPKTSHKFFKSAKPTTAKCQLCSSSFKNDVKNLKRHALQMHFGSAVFECSECGYGRKAEAFQVSNHVRLMHPGDVGVRVVDHSAAYASQIQQCLDSCFPDHRLSVVSAKGKRKREIERIPPFSEATIQTNNSATEFDQPGTSGYAAIEVGESAEEMERSGFASNSHDENDEENEASLALVKQELLLQSGHMKNAVVAISSADVAAALKNLAVKTEKFNDD